MQFQNQSQPYNLLLTDPDTREENFGIFLRLKPTVSQEPSEVIRQLNDTRVQIVSPYYNESQRVFHVDHVFPTRTTNRQLFDKSMDSPISNVLAGFNTTVLIYGSTGAGKTYTMFGDDGEEGVVSMTLSKLFESVTRDEKHSELSVSFYQIYNETIRDLLQEDSILLNIMQDPYRGTFVNDLSEHILATENDARCILEKGLQHRAMNATRSNEVSSRSHAIFQLTLKQYSSSLKGQKCSLTQSKLFLVDLAGNQKSSSSSHSLDKRFVEGVNINKSLLTLGKCINILSERKNQFVPFRDSKLTRILKQSLGGNSKTIIIACVSMEKQFYQETLNTLKYISLAKNIKNKRTRITKEVDKPVISRSDTNQHRPVVGQGGIFLQLIQALAKSMEEKSKTAGILGSLGIAQAKNQELWNRTKDASILQKMKQISRLTEQIGRHHQTAVLKSQELVKKLVGLVEAKESKDVKGNDYNNLAQQYNDSLRQIQYLKNQLKQKDNRITQLQKSQKMALNVSVLSHSSTLNTMNSLNNINVQHQMSKNPSRTSVRVSALSKKPGLQIDTKSSIILQKENVTGASKLFNKKSKEIIIDLNTKSSKERFVQDLRVAQRNVKEPQNQKQIQRLVSLNQLHQYDLNNSQQSILRKLKFFQNKRLESGGSSERRFPIKGASLGRSFK